MKQYLDLLQDILENGVDKMDRTGVGTRSVFGRQIRFNLARGFPAVTTKKLAWKAVVSELLWFLEGSTNIHRLAEIKNDNKPYEELNEKERFTIWNANYECQGKALGYEDGELGPIYGSQWRNFNYEGIDQVQQVVDKIKINPNDRRLIVSAWNPASLEMMSLPPCHMMYQFYVINDKLSLMWYQRSVDSCTGLPFNIASYALLLHIVSKMTNKIPYELIGTLGDTHIYNNHFDGAKEQISRTPRLLPTLQMPDIDWTSSIDDVLKQVKTSDFQLLNYLHDEPIRFDMAV